MKRLRLPSWQRSLAAPLAMALFAITIPAAYAEPGMACPSGDVEFLGTPVAAAADAVDIVHVGFEQDSAGILKLAVNVLDASYYSSAASMASASYYVLSQLTDPIRNQSSEWSARADYVPENNQQWVFRIGAPNGSQAVVPGLINLEHHSVEWHIPPGILNQSVDGRAVIPTLAIAWLAPPYPLPAATDRCSEDAESLWLTQDQPATEKDGSSVEPAGRNTSASLAWPAAGAALAFIGERRRCRKSLD